MRVLYNARSRSRFSRNKTPMKNSFDTKVRLIAGDNHFEIYNPIRIPSAEKLPYSLKILLENLLRYEDGEIVTSTQIEALLKAHNTTHKPQEIAYRPARILMQDFTGVPALVDLAAMREAMKALGKDPQKINPLQPTELVIDHSLQVDSFGTPEAFDINKKIEFQRNKERYRFLKWGQSAFSNFKVVPPGSGIVHQVNIEYLARVVFNEKKNGTLIAYPDTLVGTDSHTTMVNGIGVLGWGVGGIEAEASMLGQTLSMLIPKVVGFRLDGKLPEGTTATDLVLTIVQILREYGVVGKFVEFYGPGLANLPLGDRCTIANMAPEYGATCGIFPIDDQTLNYLKLTGRSMEHIALIEAYAKETGLWHDDSRKLQFDERLQLDLKTVVPSLAGPKRPQDRIQLSAAKEQFITYLKGIKTSDKNNGANIRLQNTEYRLTDGSVVIAAITSCTNTSNPSVMIAAGLLAKKAAEKGLAVKPWVKTSLAPGSRAVTDYLKRADLIKPLQSLGFYVVGYGCTTCIGNSGPLPPEIDRTIEENDLAAAAILSGNRNFEGRIHQKVRLNYLASPPLVVAYALAGTMNFDMYHDSLGQNSVGEKIYLRDIWPTTDEVAEIERQVLSPEQFDRSYAHIFDGDEQWQALAVDKNILFDWSDSTYIAEPPYFRSAANGMKKDHIENARVLAFLGDSVTTDHISPAGSIQPDSPAGKFLQEHSVHINEFNSYGARRGNHHVMVRGTFANIRLRNRLVPEVEGGYTRHLPSNVQMPIYDTAIRYHQENTPTIILAGKEYGSGSSRDWAAKGPFLQGVRAVIAESFERIHRSNLVGMGILPLQYQTHENAETLRLSGEEIFHIKRLRNGESQFAEVTARKANDELVQFITRVRIDTPREEDYYNCGGILPYVLSQLTQ